MTTFAAKLTLGASLTFTISMISYVHLSQNWERKRLRQGVVNDIGRQEMKQRNREMMEQQQELTKILTAAQQNEAQTS